MVAILENGGSLGFPVGNIFLEKKIVDPKQYFCQVWCFFCTLLLSPPVVFVHSFTDIFLKT